MKNNSIQPIIAGIIAISCTVLVMEHGDLIKSQQWVTVLLSFVGIFFCLAMAGAVGYIAVTVFTKNEKPRSRWEIAVFWVIYIVVLALLAFQFSK